MIPGPDYILSCPQCGALARCFTLLEADESGTVAWTDGFQLSPNAPRQPNLVRCHHCGKLHWLVEAGQVGIIDPPEMVEDGAVPRFALVGEEPPEPGTPPPPDWVSAPQIHPLEEEDYVEAIREGMGRTVEQELELRVHAWWRGNDRFRNRDGPGRHPTSGDSVENLHRILELTEEGDHELLLFRAEAYRQLGHFNEAEEVLYGLCSDYALARQKMIDLIRERSRDLEVLFG